jgi:hypothetical protein
VVALALLCRSAARAAGDAAPPVQQQPALQEVDEGFVCAVCLEKMKEGLAVFCAIPHSASCGLKFCSQFLCLLGYFQPNKAMIYLTMMFAC